MLSEEALPYFLKDLIHFLSLSLLHDPNLPCCVFALHPATIRICSLSSSRAISSGILTRKYLCLSTLSCTYQLSWGTPSLLFFLPFVTLPIIPLSLHCIWSNSDHDALQCVLGSHCMLSCFLSFHFQPLWLLHFHLCHEISIRMYLRLNHSRLSKYVLNFLSVLLKPQPFSLSLSLIPSTALRHGDVHFGSHYFLLQICSILHLLSWQGVSRFPLLPLVRKPEPGILKGLLSS